MSMYKKSSLPQLLFRSNAICLYLAPSIYQASESLPFLPNQHFLSSRAIPSVFSRDFTLTSTSLALVHCA